jgi:flagellar basal body-associated protein FliL
MSAPEKKEDEAPAAAGASKKPLIIIGLVALLAGAGVGLFVLPGIVHVGGGAPEGGAGEPATDGEAGEQGAAEGEQGGEAGEHAEGAPDAAFSDRIVQFEPFVVNVTGESYPRYLKLQVVFEMSSVAAKLKLEERMAQVRDLTISLLSSKRLADITDFEGKALLKDDLRTQVDELLGRDSVESVLFTEFVVQ